MHGAQEGQEDAEAALVVRLGAGPQPLHCGLHLVHGGGFDGRGTLQWCQGRRGAKRGQRGTRGSFTWQQVLRVLQVLQVLQVLRVLRILRVQRVLQVLRQGGGCTATRR